MPASCLQAPPCGGDLVGTWRLLGGCVNGADLTASASANCPARSVAGTVDISGTATFGADLSYSFEAAQTITFFESIPLSCTTFASCSELQADRAMSSATLVTTCTGTTTCDCISTTSVPNTAVTGTYTTSGTNVVLTASTSTDPKTDAYCVQGNTLHLMSLNPTTGKIFIDDVAQRQ